MPEAPKHLKENFEQIKILYKNYLKAKASFKEIESLLEEKKSEFENLCINHFQDHCPSDKKFDFKYLESDKISLEIYLIPKSGFDLLP